MAGKSPATLRDPSEIADRHASIVNEDASDLEKGLEFRDKKILQSVWVNVSLKKAKFLKCDFSHAIFFNCYFRGAQFTDCDFTGCRFVGCNFRSSSVTRCNLQYTRWEKTHIRRSTLLGNLPRQANVAQELLIQLRLNASSVGEYDDARYYLYQAEKRSREHFVEIIRCREDYYRDKYAVSLDRISAPFRYIRSLVNWLLWGYGERPLVLTLNGLLFLTALGLIRVCGDSSVDIWHAFKASLAAFVGLGLTDVEKGEPPNIWALAQSLFGLLYIAFLAASLHRRVSTRRD